MNPDFSMIGNIVKIGIAACLVVGLTTFFGLCYGIYVLAKILMNTPGLL